MVLEKGTLKLKTGILKRKVVRYELKILQTFTFLNMSNIFILIDVKVTFYPYLFFPGRLK